MIVSRFNLKCQVVRSNVTREYQLMNTLSCYLIFKKVIMWIHIQGKIILELQRYLWKSIINTGQKTNNIVRIFRYWEEQHS